MKLKINRMHHDIWNGYARAKHLGCKHRPEIVMITNVRSSVLSPLLTLSFLLGYLPRRSIVHPLSVSFMISWLIIVLYLRILLSETARNHRVKNELVIQFGALFCPYNYCQDA